MSADPQDEADGEAGAATGGLLLEVELDASAAGRLDRALAAHPLVQAADLSRERLKALMALGAVTRADGAALTPASPARAGLHRIAVPPPVEALPQPQDLPLTVLWEDADLIVVDKPAGMAAHPAPGTPDGTLVNALLHRCGASLSGIGGVLRPGIVHRLDKDTSGVMVAAKSDRAHAGLSALFAAHDIERRYTALVRGAPQPARGTVATRLGRSPHDRQKMAVLRAGGREAVTHYRIQQAWGPAERPAASRVLCELETGRTHQIRVHMAHKGAPCLGDPVYGSGAPAAAVRRAMEESGLARQALHAQVLGFVHPVTGGRLRFEAPPPGDMQRLGRALDAGFD